MTAWVDLHLHSLCSDGAETPEQLVARATATGAEAIALTDHDAVTGVRAAQQAAEAAGIGFLTGVEISAQYNNRELHVVGLGINPEDESLQQLLQELADMRHNRIRTIYKRLQAIGITLDDALPEKTDNNAPGRMHVAVALCNMGLAPTVQKAFDRYLNRGRPAHVPKKLPPADRAIAVIQAAGGRAFIAHPGLGDWMLKRLDALLTLPFDGVEAWHPSHDAATTQHILAIAERRNLLISGGSDCHGNVKGDGVIMGRVKTPARYFYQIVSALG